MWNPTTFLTTDWLSCCDGAATLVQCLVLLRRTKFPHRQSQCDAHTVTMTMMRMTRRWVSWHWHGRLSSTQLRYPQSDKERGMEQSSDGQSAHVQSLCQLLLTSTRVDFLSEHRHPANWRWDSVGRSYWCSTVFTVVNALHCDDRFRNALTHIRAPVDVNPL